jgi:lactoylglutathione lyase
MKLALIISLLTVFLLSAAENVKRPKILGVAHMAFYVSNLPKARAFYEDYLGFGEPYSLKGKDGSDKTAIIKINDNQYIELTADQPKNDGQLSHIAFYTDDINSMYEYLSSCGIKVPEKIDKGRAGNLAFTITDPDNHVIEFVQYEPDSWTSREIGKFMPVTRIGIRIDHIGITSADEELSNKFYRDILGFIGNGKPKVPDGTERIEFGTYHKTPTVEFRGSRNHLCLISSTDVEQAVEILKKRNPGIPIETHILKKRNWHANISDPDGTRIELVNSK